MSKQPKRTMYHHLYDNIKHNEALTKDRNDIFRTKEQMEKFHKLSQFIDDFNTKNLGQRWKQIKKQQIEEHIAWFEERNFQLLSDFSWKKWTVTFQGVRNGPGIPLAPALPDNMSSRKSIASSKSLSSDMQIDGPTVEAVPASTYVPQFTSATQATSSTSSTSSNQTEHLQGSSMNEDKETGEKFCEFKL